MSLSATASPRSRLGDPDLDLVGCPRDRRVSVLGELDDEGVDGSLLEARGVEREVPGRTHRQQASRIVVARGAGGQMRVPVAVAVDAVLAHQVSVEVEALDVDPDPHGVANVCVWLWVE